MILVDTSVWVEAFRRANCHEAEHLRVLLDAGEVAMTSPVRIEILSGSSATELPRLRRTLSALPLFVPGVATWERVEGWVEPAVRAGRRFGPADLLIAATAAAEYDIKKQAELRKMKGPEPRIYGELSRLADQYGTDKGNLDHTPDSGWYGWVHNYTPFYEAHLDPIRLSARKVMEIRVWHGSSMRLWRDYFQNAQIYGLDIDPSLVTGEPLGDRVTLLKADAGNRQSLADVLEKVGSDWDLILDDGSHSMNDQQTAFAVLFPHVRPGGWYVIEDLHTSFFPRPVVNATTGEAEWPGDENPFGVDLDGSNATIVVVEALAAGKPIQSRYMTEEEMAFINREVEECIIYALKSMTAMIRRRR